jgi:hypothetical protein
VAICQTVVDALGITGLRFCAVPLREWIDLSALKGQSKHTSAVAGALLSFYLISLLAKWIIGPGKLATVIGYVDEFVLVVVVLLYAIRLLYDIFKGLRGNGNASFVLVA